MRLKVYIFLNTHLTLWTPKGNKNVPNKYGNAYLNKNVCGIVQHDPLSLVWFIS